MRIFIETSRCLFLAKIRVTPRGCLIASRLLLIYGKRWQLTIDRVVILMVFLINQKADGFGNGTLPLVQAISYIRIGYCLNKQCLISYFNLSSV